MNTELVARPALPHRRFIQLAGGGAVLAVLPLASCSSANPPAAVRALQAPDDTTDLRRWMLAHALLAPNPHNRQSWIADLKRDTEITLVCDADRLLPEIDPFGRQVLIGCGAFIEPAVIAAAERGHRVSVDLFPEGVPNRRELPGGSAVARLRVAPNAALRRDPLFAQIRRRHTRKGAYDSARAVPSALWRARGERDRAWPDGGQRRRTGADGGAAPHHARFVRDRDARAAHLARVRAPDAHRPGRGRTAPRRLITDGYQRAADGRRRCVRSIRGAAP